MARNASAVEKARRLWQLPELLRQKERTTIELSDRFGVPPRTIQRDLETLREEGFAVESPARGVYRLPAGPTTLNAMEGMAVHAATRLLYHHAPTGNRYYRSAMEKLAALLPEPARSVALRGSEAVAERSGDDRALELAARAWFERRVLTCEYRATGGSGRWRPNELEIYLIEVSRDNLAPYVIAFERSFHRRVRTWKLSRMRNVMLGSGRYEIPEDFDPMAYLANAWGVMGTSGGPIVTIALRFAVEVADRVREGDFPGVVSMQEEANGSLRVTIRAGTDSDGFPREILPWVQGWGPRVEVLEPIALRRRWLEEARAVADRAEDEASRIDADER